MKKLLLIAFASAAFTGSFAQRTNTVYPAAKIGMYSTSIFGSYNSEPNARITASGDTLVLSNISHSDSLTIYSLGSGVGFSNGTNTYGDLGFAERYDFNAGDSSLQVLGVVALFAGTYSVSTTKTASFKLWDVGKQNTVDSQYVSYLCSYNGLPNLVLDSSLAVPISQLGINLTNDSLDTPKIYLFPAPSAYLDSPFYVGCNIYYNPAALNGDTIAVVGSYDSDRVTPAYTLSGSDTIINVQNASERTYNGYYYWVDDNFDDGLYNDLYLFPIVVVKYTSGVSNVTKNNLTFYGNYPNPAVTNTNIRFSLAEEADVTVQIEDLSGRVINTIEQSDLSEGEHIIQVNTSSMAAGNYLYLIRTSDGDGIASEISVVK